MDAAIEAALNTQQDGHGDDRPAPTLPSLYRFAVDHFGAAIKEASDGFMACSSNVANPAVFDKLGFEVLTGIQQRILKNFFGGHLYESEDKPRGHLGSKAMSFLLQISDDPAFMDIRKQLSSKPASEDPAFFPTIRNSTDLAIMNAMKEAGLGGDRTEALDWDTKYLTIGDAGVGGDKTELSKEFEDPSGLDLIILLNRLVNGETWLNRVAGPDSLHYFELNFRTLKKSRNETKEVLFVVKAVAGYLLEVLMPGLQVRIGANSVTGGTTDISVAIYGINEREEWWSTQTAIIQAKEPYFALRAASYLAFGDEPTKEDYSALAENLTETETTKKRLENTLKQFECFNKKPLKRTVRLTDDDNGEEEAVFGYTCDRVDVTEELNKGYLEEPLHVLHDGLVDAARLASLNGCRSMAVLDGFTLVATHLRNLVEHQPGVVTANFDSHYTLDLTERGSFIKVLQYIMNSFFQDSRARQYAMVLLTAAAAGNKKGDSGEVSAVKSAALKDLVERLQTYKFDSSAYPQDLEVLRESASLFAKSRDSAVKEGLDGFVKAFGDIAECGEYKSTDFGLLLYFRHDEKQGIPSDYGRIPGRSRNVSLVNFRGHSSHGKDECSTANIPRVLKVFDADAASIERMERELKAYLRIAKLAKADQKHIAELIAFGAIDLGGADPRLFILTEYVEYYTLEYEATSKKLKCEIDKVGDILRSVGVNHNDMDERNYKWQEADDGQLFIKVFDFDLATFDDSNGLDDGVKKQNRPKKRAADPSFSQGRSDVSK